ncbi:hypothetical protein BGW38_007439 [Lunasporangiospora selenospora]|uniref:F-box domain-containing protein n=1 Tax=Lunasporangiospora selenospora TaxID=979761 RepID=A0A9P6FZN6_9FUNG|nr:hypothetical protein BGW38_007439 [Lunasporangiospora selenospora]
MSDPWLTPTTLELPQEPIPLVKEDPPIPKEILEKIPPEIWHRILTFIPPARLAVLTIVSREWQAVIRQGFESHWRQLAQQCRLGEPQGWVKTYYDLVLGHVALICELCLTRASKGVGSTIPLPVSREDAIGRVWMCRPCRRQYYERYPEPKRASRPSDYVVKGCTSAWQMCSFPMFVSPSASSSSASSSPHSSSSSTLSSHASSRSESSTTTSSPGLGNLSTPLPPCGQENTTAPSPNVAPQVCHIEPGKSSEIEQGTFAISRPSPSPSSSSSSSSLSSPPLSLSSSSSSTPSSTSLPTFPSTSKWSSPACPQSALNSVPPSAHAEPRKVLVQPLDTSYSLSHPNRIGLQIVQWARNHHGGDIGILAHHTDSTLGKQLRPRRRRLLTTLLELVRLKLRSDSKLCGRYLSGSRDDPFRIVEVMREMDWYWIATDYFEYIEDFGSATSKSMALTEWVQETMDRFGDDAKVMYKKPLANQHVSTAQGFSGTVEVVIRENAVVVLETLDKEEEEEEEKGGGENQISTGAEISKRSPLPPTPPPPPESLWPILDIWLDHWIRGDRDYHAPESVFSVQTESNDDED